jgi:hypothetical protein
MNILGNRIFKTTLAWMLIFALTLGLVPVRIAFGDAIDGEVDVTEGGQWPPLQGLFLC